MASQKRRFQRVDSLNLLSYFCVNKNEEIINQGMGRTLNVSEGGILLETHVQIPQETIIFLSIGFDDQVTDVKGKIAYTKKGENGRFQSGIKFVYQDERAGRIITKYVEAFDRHFTHKEEDMPDNE